MSSEARRAYVWEPLDAGAELTGAEVAALDTYAVQCDLWSAATITAVARADAPDTLTVVSVAGDDVHPMAVVVSVRSGTASVVWARGCRATPASNNGQSA